MKINEIINEGKTGPGLWANIAKKRASGAKMREKGAPGAPTEKALKAAQAGSKNESVSEDKDPCWDSYKQVGMKTKGGRKVPNCVPKEGVAEGLAEALAQGNYNVGLEDIGKRVTLNGKTGDPAGYVLIGIKYTPGGLQAQIVNRNLYTTGYYDLNDISKSKDQTLGEQGVAEGLNEPPVSYREMINSVQKQYTKWYSELVNHYAQLGNSSDEFKKKIVAAYNAYKNGQSVAHIPIVGPVKEQGVAEGFSDIVKGVKRKVAGKSDPKEVEHTYGRIARSAIKHKTPDQAEKDIERYKKVAKVVNKEGVAEGYNDISVGDYVSYDDGPGTDRWEVVSIEGNRVELRNDQGGTTFADINDVLKEQGVAGKGSQLEETYHDDDEFFEAYGVMEYNDEMINEAKYQGRTVALNKPMQGDVKKFKVYVKNPNGNVVKVNFGQKGAKIKKNNPGRRKNFRARHNCDNPGPKTSARYWSCRKW